MKFGFQTDMTRLTHSIEDGSAEMEREQGATPILHARQTSVLVAQLQAALFNPEPVRSQLQDGLVVLRAWPQLAHLPEEIATKLARICALLWRKPTTAHLVPLVLHTDPLETAVMLCVLERMGYVENLLRTAVAYRTQPLEAAKRVEPGFDTTLPLRDVHSLQRAQVVQPAHDSEQKGLIARLWARLGG